jgi:hypothetical protein
MGGHELKMKIARILAGLLISLAGTFLGCSADDNGGSPGLCSLKCSDAKITGNDARIRLVSEPPLIDCTTVAIPAGKNAAEYFGPVTIQFVAEVVRKLRYKNPLDPDAAEAEEKVDDIKPTDGKLWTPLAGVAIEPTILGGLMAGDRTSRENATVEADGKVSPFKYAGVVTPQSEWCSDSCGVVTLEIWPICTRATNLVTMNIHSGALYSDRVAFAISGSAAVPLTSEINPAVKAELIESKKDAARP